MTNQVKIPLLSYIMLRRLNVGLNARLTRKIAPPPYATLLTHCSTLLTLLTRRFTLQSGKGLKFHAMPIATIETNV